MYNGLILSSFSACIEEQVYVRNDQFSTINILTGEEYPTVLSGEAWLDDSTIGWWPESPELVLAITLDGLTKITGLFGSSQEVVIQLEYSDDGGITKKLSPGVIAE